MKKTWTRNYIIEAISDSVGLSLSESSIIIEEIFELILSGLENGEEVKIKKKGHDSTFGDAGDLKIKLPVAWCISHIRKMEPLLSLNEYIQDTLYPLTHGLTISDA